MPRRAHFVEILQAADTCYEYPADSPFTNNSNFFVNLLCGLNQCKAGLAFLIDYDCLYPPGYFDHDVATDAVNVTDSMVYLSEHGFFSREQPTTSTVCGDRDFLRELIWEQLRQWDDESATIAKTSLRRRVSYELDIPAVDIRHGRNWSGRRDSRKGNHQDDPYWGNAQKLFAAVTAGT
jgi:hypothetical protein